VIAHRIGRAESAADGFRGGRTARGHDTAPASSIFAILCTVERYISTACAKSAASAAAASPAPRVTTEILVEVVDRAIVDVTEARHLPLADHDDILEIVERDALPDVDQRRNVGRARAIDAMTRLAKGGVRVLGASHAIRGKRNSAAFDFDVQPD